MGGSLAAALASLDVGTLFFVAICVTMLLGLFLLHAWLQEGNRALACYLIGGASGVLWRFGETVAPVVPSGTSTVLLFIAVGMTWSGARSFHGRPIRWPVMAFGAAFWMAASCFPAFAESPASRTVVSALIVAGYTFLTAAELRRERRKSLIRRWPAIFVPMLHGAIFLFPVALATLCCMGEGGQGLAQGLARGWIVVFAIEIVLYVVGTAFIVLILAKDRTVNRYKMAAATDPLTGLLNRRGFFEAAGSLMAISRRQRMAPVSVLVFDLDHFKAINDKSGHATGDAMLQLFAKIARETLRATDIVGRLGGEEFVALLPNTAAEAAVAAERVRVAFAVASIVSDGQRIAATVSIGVASGSPATAIDLLITRADDALYRAKSNGRNRVEIAGEPAETPAASQDRAAGAPRGRGRKEQGAVDGAPESCVA